MTQKRSSTKLRLSGIHTTTVNALSLEANSLTVHYLEDLFVVVPNIRGARTVPLGAGAHGLLVSSAGNICRSTISRVIIGEVDRLCCRSAKEVILARLQVLFVIPDPPVHPDLVIVGVTDLLLIRHRRPPVPHGPAQEEPKKKQLVGGRQGLTRVRVSVAYLQIRSIGFAGEVDEEARRKGPGITRPGLGFGMASRRPEMGEEDGTRRGRIREVVSCRSSSRRRRRGSATSAELQI